TPASGLKDPNPAPLDERAARVDREALESSSLGFQPSACSVSATDPTKKARSHDDTWPLHANAREAQVSQAQRANGQTMPTLIGVPDHRLSITEIKPTPGSHPRPSDSSGGSPRRPLLRPGMVRGGSGQVPFFLAHCPSLRPCIREVTRH